MLKLLKADYENLINLIHNKQITKYRLMVKNTGAANISNLRVYNTQKQKVEKIRDIGGICKLSKSGVGLAVFENIKILDNQVQASDEVIEIVDADEEAYFRLLIDTGKRLNNIYFLKDLCPLCLDNTDYTSEVEQLTTLLDVLILLYNQDKEQERLTVNHLLSTIQ